MKKSNARTASKLAIAASMLAVPAVSQDAVAQKPTSRGAITQPETIIIKNMVKNVAVKFNEAVQIVGVDNARIIYRNKRGEQFYLDPATGDMRFVSDLVVKQTLSLVASKEVKSTRSVNGAVVMVNIVGTDDKGNVLHTDSAGNVFYLDPKTGDMVYVK